jgi:hypothetical protein
LATADGSAEVVVVVAFAADRLMSHTWIENTQIVSSSGHGVRTLFQPR